MIKRLLILLLVLQAVLIGLLATGLYYWWRPAWESALSAPSTAACTWPPGC
jgi:hypothetical protein